MSSSSLFTSRGNPSAMVPMITATIRASSPTRLGSSSERSFEVFIGPIHSVETGDLLVDNRDIRQFDPFAGVEDERCGNGVAGVKLLVNVNQHVAMATRRKFNRSTGRDLDGLNWLHPHQSILVLGLVVLEHFGDRGFDCCQLHCLTAVV